MSLEPTEIALSELLPDHKNPRIPLSARDLSNSDLLIYLAKKYDSLIIAKSIINNRYFPSEPLIVVKEDGNSIVVEGNRRLAALKLLANPEEREKMPDVDEWSVLGHIENDYMVPVVVADSRRQVAPIIGYRHIAGVEPWDPFAKARYLASQIDDEKLTFEEAAKEVGEKINDVKAHYRNYKIAIQAEGAGIDVSDMTENFGVFTRAMSSDVKEFIGAPAPRDVERDKDPVPKEKLEELKELVSMMFGEKAILGESRNLGKLAAVLNSEEGLNLLRKKRNLNDAYIASGGLLQGLLNRLGNAVNNLRAAVETIDDYKGEPEVRDLLDECEALLKELRS